MKMDHFFRPLFVRTENRNKKNKTKNVHAVYGWTRGDSKPIKRKSKIIRNSGMRHNLEFQVSRLKYSRDFDTNVRDMPLSVSVQFVLVVLMNSIERIVYVELIERLTAKIVKILSTEKRPFVQMVEKLPIM